ncbi:MAG: methyltransferase domain-containing protein [Candidatus Nanohaloarchaeota archaeon QJJ-9]|nr:methyltransferase domain-containing protein [Candidatus Nanohaloarchaeota archaeon QJJ-9]
MEKELEETIEAYKNMAEEYDDYHNSIEEIEGTLKRFLEEVDGKKILDVGCGPGRDAKFFAKKGKDVVGIDPVKKFLEIAREKVPQAEFRKMDMRYLKFGDASFNGIWACASLHHLPKQEADKALEELHRVLKEGGTVHISVKKGEKEKYIERDHYSEGRRFFALYTEKELREKVEKAGLNVLKEDTEKDRKEDWVRVLAKK